MNHYSILSFIAFLLYLQAGAYIFNKLSHRPLNIVFSLLCLAFSIFAFFSAFLYSASTIEQVYFYDRLAAIGWTTFPILMVIFFVLISGNKSKLILSIVKFVLLPMAVGSFVLIVIFNELEASKLYYHYGQTWRFVLSKNSIPVYAFILYLLLSVFLSLIILVNWYLSTKTNRGRRQAIIILMSLFVFFIASTFSNIVIPFLDIAMVPALAPINSIFWVAGVFYALIRYQRDVLSSDVISNLIINHINEFVLFFDNKKRVFAANNFTLNNLSYSSGEITRLSVSDIVPDPKMLEMYLEKFGKQKSTSQIRTDLINSNGDHIEVLLSLLSITDKFNNNFGFVLIGIDNRQKSLLEKEIAERKKVEKRLNNMKDDLELIVQQNTKELFDANKKLQIEILERKRAEAQIKHDLDEKIKLVSEVHHRVKNNIQIIISLINMLASHKDVTTDDSEKILQIAERVRVVSAIHDILYSSKRLSSIDFTEFIRRKTEELSSNLMYGGKKKKIKYKFNLLQQYLEIDKAIPCAIIFHELMANAINFAFPESNDDHSDNLKQKNIIQVGFYKEDDEYTLSVRDNGVGLPGELSAVKKNSVGLQMVNILTKHHLKGDLKISSSSGTTVIIRFS